MTTEEIAQLCVDSYLKGINHGIDTIGNSLKNIIKMYEGKKDEFIKEVLLNLEDKKQ